MKLLSKYGADPKIADQQGKTVQMMTDGVSIDNLPPKDRNPSPAERVAMGLFLTAEDAQDSIVTDGRKPVGSRQRKQKKKKKRGIFDDSDPMHVKGEL
eukprot:SAG31_NODE_232_length_19710_cov_17.109581_8_plen_98_part_00